MGAYPFQDQAVIGMCVHRMGSREIQKQGFIAMSRHGSHKTDVNQDTNSNLTHLFLGWG